MTTHTEESLMALADQWAEGEPGCVPARDALRLAIREVLAERDRLFASLIQMGEWRDKALERAEKAEAEVERLRELIAELDGHEGAEGWSEGMRERIDAALKEQP